MTALEKEIQKMPKTQMISIMEQIWTELSKEENSIDIPDWHLEELEKTENRIKEGKENFIDWESAKEAIRNA